MRKKERKIQCDIKRSSEREKENDRVIKRKIEWREKENDRMIE